MTNTENTTDIIPDINITLHTAYGRQIPAVTSLQGA